MSGTVASSRALNEVMLGGCTQAHVARIGRIRAGLERDEALEVPSAATVWLHPLKSGQKGLWSI